MKESVLNESRVLGTDSSFDVVATTRKTEECTVAQFNHLFKKLKGFFAEKFEKLKDLIDEMSLYPERRF